MRKTKRIAIGLAGLSVLVSGCDGHRYPAGPAGVGADGAVVRASDSRGASDALAVREIAATYRRWGRADDGARWAPTLCAPAAPPVAAGGAAAAKISRAEGGGDAAHGRKLFLLYAA